MTSPLDTGALVRGFRAAGLVADVEWPLGPLTTYGVGGTARCGVVIESDDDARRAAVVLAENGPAEVLVVGRGSNLLVSDAGFPGVAVVSPAGRAGEDDIVTVDGLIVASGRTPMPVLARRAGALGCGGLEWAVGIPGSVGGAVRMNAGGHGSDMEASLVSVRLLSLLSARVEEVEAESLGLHFRGSALASSHLVLAARLRCDPVDPGSSSSALADIVAWRREHQPGGRNAGSVFVNPGSGDRSAGALVDACGLRGMRIGGAEVSTKHANFIVAAEDARADDIVRLMTAVQEAVLARHGVLLHSEVRLVGFDEETSSRFSDPRHRSPEHAARARALRLRMGERP